MSCPSTYEYVIKWCIYICTYICRQLHMHYILFYIYIVWFMWSCMADINLFVFIYKTPLICIKYLMRFNFVSFIIIYLMDKLNCNLSTTFVSVAYYLQHLLGSCFLLTLLTLTNITHTSCGTKEERSLQCG